MQARVHRNTLTRPGKAETVGVHADCATASAHGTGALPQADLVRSVAAYVLRIVSMLGLVDGPSDKYAPQRSDSASSICHSRSLSCCQPLQACDSLPCTLSQINRRRRRSARSLLPYCGFLA